MIPREQAFLRAFGSMPAAYEAAGLPQYSPSPYSRENLIELLREYYREVGEVPRASRKYGRHHGDCFLPPGFPTRKVFKRVFGSMDAAYKAAGLQAPKLVKHGKRIRYAAAS